MDANRSPRTFFVTFVGWLGIVFGLATMLAGAAMAYLFDKFLGGPDLDGQLAELASDPRINAVNGWLLTHPSVFFVATMAFGAAVMAVSAGLLRRRNWGRLGFLAVLWLGIATNLAGAALTILLVQVIPAQAAREVANLGVDFQRIAWGLIATVVGIVVMVVALHAWIIQQLSSADARREFGKG